MGNEMIFQKEMFSHVKHRAADVAKVDVQKLASPCRRKAAVALVEADLTFCNLVDKPEVKIARDQVNYLESL